MNRNDDVVSLKCLYKYEYEYEYVVVTYVCMYEYIFVMEENLQVHTCRRGPSVWITCGGWPRVDVDADADADASANTCTRTSAHVHALHSTTGRR